MTEVDASRRAAILLYAGACPKCRWMSFVIEKLALGALTRVPLERAEAFDFYREHPEAHGRPVLLDEGRLTFGWRVLHSVPRLILTVWWRRLRRLLHLPSSRTRSI